MKLKEIYKKNKEDVSALFEIFKQEPKIEIGRCDWVLKQKDGKAYNCYEVKINGKKTYFTYKLHDYLIEKEIILKT